MHELFEEVARVPSTTANSTKRTRLSNKILDSFLECESHAVRLDTRKFNLESRNLYKALMSANRQKKFRRAIEIHKDKDYIYLSRIDGR